jgi:hypothetical protein
MKEAQHVSLHQCTCRVCAEGLEPEVSEHHRKLNLVLAHAGERQRRLTVGLLSQQEGGSSDLELSQITGLDPKTIRRGRRELGETTTDWPPGRQRRAGGGRQRSEKKILTWSP